MDANRKNVANSISTVSKFESELQPYESGHLVVLTDNRTAAPYCECHIKASKLVALATVDAPLDPSQQGYKANRELLADEPAFHLMKEDALNRRTFSNIVAEYLPDTSLPLKIIGGQHRFEAIKHAHEKGIDELQGVKVYFDLNMEQRLDVQTISNTNLAISGALVDRLRETFRGPSLRDWCQGVGLLKPKQDFSDRTGRGLFPVHLARTFIANFYLGKKADLRKFAQIETTPLLYSPGKDDKAWSTFIEENPGIWDDAQLREAGKQYAKLIASQRKAFAGKSGVAEFSEKALNAAVLSAWAYTAGALQANKSRLKRHYSIAAVTSPDPLNAKVLAQGRHKSDDTNYRGLGYRTDARERSQLVELFYILAEDGSKINAKNVNAAVLAHFAKKSALEAKKARGSK